ncbi:preprotein translocase subunit SecG [Flavobacterium aquaticum]|uniref:Protein-export membrane protein SecG n=1 Tax=Flavobacterium aquaticum TaxID=1236486 RepID=A0A327YUI2_9FLAO|nr:preprotein translocase subunit SecG [Flavobacterium aquaticum]
MGFTGFLIAITIVCFLLILAIMVQNPKGGGLSSSFGGSQQLGGVQKTTDFLDKSTWTLGGILIALILLSSLSFNGAASGSKVLGNDDTTVPTTTVPTTPEATKQAAPTATPAPVATDSTK